MEQINNSSNRKKILFVAEAVTLAHMARPAVLAGSLDPEEFEVVLAAHPRYRHLFSDLKLRHVDIHSIPTEQFLHTLTKGTPLYDTATLEQYVEDDLRIIDSEKPDIVVGDFRFSLSVSSRLRKIPYLSITNAYWSPYAQQTFPIPQHPLTRILGIKAAQLLFNAIRPLAFQLHALPHNRVRRKYGLDSPGLNFQRLYTDSDYLLYADIPGLVEMGDLPSTHHFIGPVLWSPPNSYPDWWNEIDDSIPVIYITFGSSGRSDLLPVVIEALEGLQVRIMLATAGRSKESLTGANLFSAQYLPGEEAAARSKLVICNGGSLTTYQALSHGVPVLGIAGNLDQHLNMSALERLGTGIRLRTDSVDPAQIRESTIRLINEKKYSGSARRMKKSLAHYPAMKRFQEVLRKV